MKMGLASQSLVESYEVWAQTDAKRALDMFNSGKSYNEIAIEFKKTKGSIAGLINRYRKKNMVLTAAERPRKAHKPGPKPGAKKRSDPIAVAIVAKPPIREHRFRLRLIESDTEVTFEQLQSFHCRFPFGDPKRPDFRFCGKSKCDEAPYCKEHCAVVYTPPPQRRR